MRRVTQRSSNILITAKNSAKPNALRSGKSTVTTVSYMMEGFLTILAETLNICYNYKLFPFCLLITSKVLKMSAKNHDCFGKVPFTFSRIQTQRAISLAVKAAFQHWGCPEAGGLLPRPALPTLSAPASQLCSDPTLLADVSVSQRASSQNSVLSSILHSTKTSPLKI